MATTSTTAKSKPSNQNLTRTRSLGRKPNPVPSSQPEANGDGSDRKTVEKPLPNYLKPTISSRPDPVKFLRKNNAVEDNQKLLRRRSYDHPPSSLTSASTSSRQKSLNTSPPARPRAAVPREKPVTGLRSTSFNGSSRGGLRGSTTVKSPPVASRGSMGVKKSGLSGTSSSKSKKEGSENVPKKSSGKEITPECSPPAPAPEEGTKKEVVQGKKESPTAYNDVIASKMQQESSRKNKVLALAGAFQTVIDYETAASK